MVRTRFWAISTYLLAIFLSRLQGQEVTSRQPLGYPALARLARIEGTVVLEFRIDSQGSPTSVRIVSGHPLLAPAATANLSTWKFSITSVNEAAEARRVTYVFEFSNDSEDGYYDPKKEKAVFEGASLVLVSTAPSGNLSANECPDGPVIDTPAQPIAATDSVMLGRSTCYGTCPSYEVTLFGDGRVQWSGHSFVELVGESTYRIDPAVAAETLGRFRSREVFGLCGDYSQSVTDSPSAITKIAISGIQKTIHDYASSSPVWFRQLQVDLDAAAETHDRRHGAPAVEPIINIRSEYLPKPGRTELMRAAARRDIATVRRLIAAVARLEETDASGWTALMYAAATWSNSQVVEELLRAGARIDHRSPYGDTVLMASALDGYFDADLTGSKSDLINAQNRDGVTALMLLAARGEEDEIRAALKAGANPKLKDRAGRTAVNYLDAISCHQSLVRGYQQFLTTTGPCSQPSKELRKARALLTAGSKRR